VVGWAAAADTSSVHHHGIAPEVTAMHKYPDYTFISYDMERPKSQSGKLAAMFGFMSVGFLIGIALLAARNWYLFL